MVRIFKHYIPFRLVLVSILEAATFFSSIPIARFLNQSDSTPVDYIFYIAFAYTLVTIFSMAAVGLYSRSLHEDFKRLVFRLLLLMVVVVILMSFLFYLLPILFMTRTTFIYALMLSGSALVVVRTLLFISIDREYFKQNIIVFGAGKKAKQLNEMHRKLDTKTIKIVGFLPIETEEVLIEQSQLISLPNTLLEYVIANDIDEIIVAIDDRRKRFPVDDVLECKVNGTQVLDVSTFFERQTGRITLNALHPSNLIFSDGFIQNNFYQLLKRLFDIMASLILLMVTWPVMIITALAIMIESGFKGTILYKQVRVGLYNENFEVFKFRSMGMDAEKNGAQWAQKVDARVTKVGEIIRKYRIDELPQLFNVIKGEMSFVGPRPERPEFVKELSEKIKFYEIRHYIKPGITGWAQICYPYGANEEDSRNKLEYDLYYMKNFSIFLDVMILLQTIQVVVWRQGSR